MESNPFHGEKAFKYDLFFKTPYGKEVKRLEGKLLREALEEFKEGELLEVGCGTGIWIEYLREFGFKEPVGLDISKDMLKVAKVKGLKKLVMGSATFLPFKDNSFDAVYFMTSLEFIVDRKRALLEAARVSRKAVVVGFLNSYSLLNLSRKVKSLFRESVYSGISFLTREELERLARWVGGKSNCALKLESFKTTLNFSVNGFVNPKLEEILGENLPFGGFGLTKFRVIKRDGAGKGD